MSGAVIQANYHELDAVARRFGQQAQGIGELRGRLQRSAQALEQGGWQGRGSAAFFGELNGQLLPATQRLRQALDEAHTVTLEIGALLRQAEQEAAAPFRGSVDGAAHSDIGRTQTTQPPIPADGSQAVVDRLFARQDALIDMLLSGEITPAQLHRLAQTTEQCTDPAFEQAFWQALLERHPELDPATLRDTPGFRYYGADGMDGLLLAALASAAWLRFQHDPAAFPRGTPLGDTVLGYAGAYSEYFPRLSTAALLQDSYQREFDSLVDKADILGLTDAERLRFVELQALMGGVVDGDTPLSSSAQQLAAARLDDVAPLLGTVSVFKAFGVDPKNVAASVELAPNSQTVYRLRSVKTQQSEVRVAEFVAEQEGIQIVLTGQKKGESPTAGIDGFIAQTGEPVQLKKLTSKDIGKVVKRANDALEDAHDLYTGVNVYIATPPEAFTRDKVIARWSDETLKPRALPVVDGTIGKYVVYCSDGTLEITPLPDGTFQFHNR